MDPKDPRHPENRARANRIRAHERAPSAVAAATAASHANFRSPPINHARVDFSNYPGGTPFLEPRARAAQPRASNLASPSIPGVSIDPASHVALSALSPEIRRLVEADLVAQGTAVSATATNLHPAAPQPSPPPSFAPGSSRLFGVELSTTNVPVSDLKRPVTTTTDHAEQQSL